MRRPFGRPRTPKSRASTRILGRTVQLSPLSTDDATLVARAAQGGATVEMVGLLYEVAGRACPSVERDEILGLTIVQLANLLGQALAISPGRWLVTTPPKPVVNAR